MLSTDFLDFLRHMADMIVLGNAQVERDHAHNMHVNAHSCGHRLGRRITLERLRCQSFLDSWKGEHMRRGGADPAVLSRATWAAYGVLTHRVRKSISKRRGAGGNNKMAYVNFHMRGCREPSVAARQAKQAALRQEYDALSADAQLTWAQRLRRRRQSHADSAAKPDGDESSTVFQSVWGAGTERWPLSPEMLTLFARGRGFTKLGRALRSAFIQQSSACGTAEAEELAQSVKTADYAATCCTLHPGICETRCGDRFKPALSIASTIHDILCGMPREEALCSFWRFTVGCALGQGEVASQCVVVCWLRYRPRLVIFCTCSVLVDPAEMPDARAVLKLDQRDDKGFAFLT
jgi:hypothetical protein